MHSNQSLVLVNYGNANGAELWNYAKEIKKEVFNKFKIQLEEEVNLIN
jgi:UDP-N-acetylmuramate dehydrogenase